MRLKHIILTGILFFIFTTEAFSQNLTNSIMDSIVASTIETDTISKIRIRNIQIKGNKKTKDFVILREVHFKIGDSLNLFHLEDDLKLARQQIYNTTLFNVVTILPEQVSKTDIDILITVEERWYIYPSPQFQPVDRNLNEWLIRYKGDLNRVNYGIKFQHFNLTGTRDALRLTLLNGYTRLVSFSYIQPYANRSLTDGFGIGATFSQSREIPYQTTYNNKLLFYNDGKFSTKTFSGSLLYLIRKKILDRHIIGVSFTNFSVTDSVLKSNYNPNLFGNTSNEQNIVDLTYGYQYIDVNNIIYPLKGKIYFVNLLKRGFGLGKGTDMLSAEAGYTKYWAFRKNYYLSMQGFGKIKLPFDLPYINQKALGYGENTLRGMQYYVIDGPLFGYLKTTFKKKIYSFSVPFPIKSISKTPIPFTFFAKTFADAGVAYNQKKYASYLNNRFLYSGGFGIDMVTFYDISIRFEYSFNQLGQKGLFLQVQSGL